MSSNDKATLLAHGLVPKAPRLPSDLATLDSRSPLEHSLAALGILDRCHAAHIRGLITETLATARAAKAAK